MSHMGRIFKSVGVALCAAAAFFGAAACAQSNVPGRNLAVARSDVEQRVALVIGNSAYKDSPLANPVNDATDIAKALGDAGFKVILKRNANMRDMRQAIREFGTELRRAQVGLFYFAGHGIQVKGNNYLVPVGADIQNEADAEDLSIDANYVMRTMEESQVKVSIAILDACRNNPFARSFRSASRGLAQMTAATGSLIAFATAPGATAADGAGRNGIYTKYLLESLRQRDTDILRVFQRTRAGVVKETGGKQTPWESTSLVGDFYFSPPAGATATDIGVAPAVPAVDSVAVEMQFWNSVKDSKSADEIQAYLEQYPSGRFAGLARARLKTLEADARKQVSTQVSIAPPTVNVQPIQNPVATLLNHSTSVNRIDQAFSAARKATGVEPYAGQPGKDVVWVPSSFVVVEKMLDMAGAGPQDVVMDLGSGDGRIPLYAALRYGSRSIGIEYDAKLVQLSKDAASRLDLNGRVSFIQGDVFTEDFSQATIVTMFLLPDLGIKLRPRLMALRPGTRILSNTFTLGDLRPDRTIEAKGECSYYCTVHLWVVPTRVGGRWRLDTPIETFFVVMDQDFRTVSGSVKGANFSAAIEEGVVNGEKISFSFVDGNGDRRTFYGKLRDDRLIGDLIDNTQGVLFAAASREIDQVAASTAAPRQ